MLWDVTIPNWSEGKPLTITNIKGDTRHDAYRWVVKWANERAGYDYCQGSLPDDVKIRPALGET